jgi:hypothetical protein
MLGFAGPIGAVAGQLDLVDPIRPCNLVELKSDAKAGS